MWILKSEEARIGGIFHLLPIVYIYIYIYITQICALALLRYYIYKRHADVEMGPRT